MSFLLDTNVVSEWMKPLPNPGVVAWLADADEDRVFLSVITFAELRYGIERLAAGSRRKRLSAYAHSGLISRWQSTISVQKINVLRSAGPCIWKPRCSTS